MFNPELSDGQETTGAATNENNAASSGAYNDDPPVGLLAPRAGGSYLAVTLAVVLALSGVAAAVWAQSL